MFRFKKTSDRNTQAFAVSIGAHQFFISYETVIAYAGPLGNCRLENSWGPTTGRHMSDMGIKGLPVVDENTLEARWAHALIDAAFSAPDDLAREAITRALAGLAGGTWTNP